MTIERNQAETEVAEPLPQELRDKPGQRVLMWVALFAIGIAWGITGPLSKIAVSTGHHPIGVTFWTAIFAALFLAVVMLIRRRGLPLSRHHVIFYLACGLLGTVIPNSLSYGAYVHLSVGVVVILMSLVPMATLMIALPLKLERADFRRIMGLILGIVAVAVIMLPEASLPERGQVLWVGLLVVVSFSYAGESIVIAAARPAGCDAVQTMFGLTLGALLILTPLVFLTGTFFDATQFTAADQAIVAIAALHMGAYLAFVWLISMAGAVFSAQVAYVVTAAGVLLGILFFQETHSVWVWAAMAIMFVGLALVKPKE